MTVGYTVLGNVSARILVRKLLADGKTDLLHRFISKKGRPFSAYLARGADGKVTFEFAPREAKTAKPKAAARPRKAVVS